MITDFNIDRIETKVYDRKPANAVNINQEIRLEHPTIFIRQSTAAPFIKDTIRTLKIEYQVNINYLNPNLGYIKLNGTIDYYNGESNIDVLKDTWELNCADNNKVKSEMANTIMMNIMPIALMLSSRLNLPPVIPIPRIEFGMNNKKDESQNYIG